MRSLCTLGLVIALGGCTSTPLPALLAAPDKQTTVALNEAAAALLDGRTVTLGSGAFTTSSTVTLEPGNRNTPLGRLATGRLQGTPEKLQLNKIGRRCVLQNTKTGVEHTVKGIACTAAP